METRFVPGTILHSFLRVGAAFGVDARAVFARVGLPVDLAALGDTWITIAQFDGLVDGFEEASGDAAFALHVGEMFQLLDLACRTPVSPSTRWRPSSGTRSGRTSRTPSAAGRG